MSLRFTTVFIHRNGLDRLKSALDSAIKASSLVDEIIIVDNASSDSSINQITKTYPAIKIIRNNSNLGYGHAANQGIKAGQGEYFLICK